MNLTEIKQAIYEQNPIAKRIWKQGAEHAYMAHILQGTNKILIGFSVPVSEMNGEIFEDEEPSMVLINWLKTPKELEEEHSVEIELLSGPGDTLGEYFVEKAINELVDKTDLTTEQVAKLLKNELVIHVGIAMELEIGTGIPQQFWLKRDANYRAKLAEIEAVFNS